MTMRKGESAEAAFVGQVVEDGDGGRMVIRITAEQTAGALYEFDWFIQPGRRMDPPHYHRTQEERFEGVAGTPHVMIDGTRHILGPGDRLVVPPGTYHTVGNPTAEMGHAIAAFRPAMNIHRFSARALARLSSDLPADLTHGAGAAGVTSRATGVTQRSVKVQLGARFAHRACARRPLWWCRARLTSLASGS